MDNSGLTSSLAEDVSDSELRKFIVTPVQSFSTDDIRKLPYSHTGESLSLFYNLIRANDGLDLPDHLRPVCLALADKNIDRLMVIISPGSGKAVHPETKVLTAEGWKAIKLLKLGDLIYSVNGQLSKVLGIFPQKKEQLYKVNFIDGRYTLTTKDHLWTVHNKNFLRAKSKNGESIPQGLYWKTHTTGELKYLSSKKRSSRWYIPLTDPVNFPEQCLPIHPYILGCLLKDDDFNPRVSARFITTTRKVIKKIEEFGGQAIKYMARGGGNSIYRVLYIDDKLSHLGLKSTQSPRFIPDIYKKGSIEQRFNLIRGLLDTNGHVSFNGGINYTSTSLQLAMDVQELVWSLGGIANITHKVSHSKYTNKQIHKERIYNVHIHFSHPDKLFSPSRERRRTLKNQHLEPLKLEIRSIEKVNEDQSICIIVDHPSSLFLVDNYIVTHNSELVSIIYPIWELGLDPNTTILGVSAAEDLMTTFLQTAMEIIEYNNLYREIFPNTIPDKKMGWSANRGIYVKRSGITAPLSFSMAGWECYDERTEVLTKRGWLRFAEVREDDEFATRKLQTKIFEWQRSTKIVEYTYNGTMLHLTSNAIDLLVTPNHRLLVSAERHFNKEQIIPMEEICNLKRSNVRIPTTSVWKGIEIVEHRFGNNIMSGDDYCAFMGMYLSKGFRIWTTYNSRLKKIFEFDDRYNYTSHMFSKTRKILEKYLIQFGYGETKFVPQDILDAIPRQQRIFWNYLLNGYGHKEKERREKVYTISKRLADNLQELAQKMGKSASVRERIFYQKCRQPASVRHIQNCSNHPLYVVSLLNSLGRTFKRNKVHYNGNVYCVSVPNGTVYVRRNGKAAWCGNSRSIVGKHAKIIIVDDLHDDKNSATEDQIYKVESWYYKTLLGRQDPSGARLLMVGRRWADDDLYGRLARSGNWLVMELPSIRTGEDLYYDALIPPRLSCVFNNFTPSSTLERIKICYGQDKTGFFWPTQPSKQREALEVRKTKPEIFETVYQSRPDRAGTVIFRDEDFRYYNAPTTIEHGKIDKEVVDFTKQFDYLIQTWDTAFSAQRVSDPSVCYTLGLKSCQVDHVDAIVGGIVPAHYDVFVLDEYLNRLDFASLYEVAINLYNRWFPDQVLVEKAASGIPLIQALIPYSVPVVPIVIRHASKRTRAINGARAGSAQGWFRQGRVFFPLGSSWVTGLKTELRSFNGARGADDSRVDSLIQGINFAIDLGVDNSNLVSNLPLLPGNQSQDLNLAKGPIHQLHTMLTKDAYNPFGFTCSHCMNFSSIRSYCRIHNTKVTVLDSCSLFTPIPTIKK